MHGGMKAMTASIRLKYWTLKPRSCFQETVYKCVTCFRFKPIVVQPIMNHIPKEYVTPSRPFKISWVDFAGPFILKESLKRKAAVIKGYNCIFICFVTKAVHIEVVVDTSTKPFLRAFNRFLNFLNLRGKCPVIYRQRHKFYGSKSAS